MKLSQATWDKAVRARAVRQAMDRKAKAVASRAQAINDSEGGTATIRVESGVRPGGRPFVNVVSDKANEEYGDSKTRRRAALRRAARGG
ncbi:hypothetical protein SEA_SCHMIDT_12 [Gordonia phage Schmidt]|uniref:Uncharacterized protein n=1 Tax=Gordonia phage Schmidt TaxID=2301697 RepID=A0A385E0D6_9CAUD|nr:head closure Hc1 [Gordonia phage Schmidt]AXQ65134.1 hypothetical protein SEA_SCHMIDT_12 [Gordonia phage Schmidt]